MKNKGKFISLSAISLLALSACSTTSEHWTNFSNRALNSAEGDKAGFVFYRSPADTSAQAVNIYINGEYQASLQAKGYTDALVCAQPQRINAVLTGTDPLYAKKHNSGKYINAEAAKQTYIKVQSDEQGNVSFDAVDEATAKSEMTSGHYQNHTLPRVDHSKTCGEHKYVLDAAALFPFNQSATSTILPKGREEIHEIAQDIQRYPGKVNQIEVVGYTDPQGSAAYNQALSQKRANTVKQLLVKSGVNSSIVTASGRGASDLLVADCAEKFSDSTALNQCNQPNRRVEIKLK